MKRMLNVKKKIQHFPDVNRTQNDSRVAIYEAEIYHKN